MNYVFAMGSCAMIYIPRFMKIGKGVQVILKFSLSNFNGRNVGITAGREL
jgi:hypothetical protein